MSFSAVIKQTVDEADLWAYSDTAIHDVQWVVFSHRC